MDWENESFVKLYTRDTADWKVMPWQSRALLPLIMRKLDRSGVLETRHGVRGVAVLVELPADVVEPGLIGLLEDGCLMQHERGYAMKNFLPAQEASKSDRLRAKESRERRRELAIGTGVQPIILTEDEPSKDANSDVTNRDASVTGRHEASHGVTPRHSLLCSADSSFALLAPVPAASPGGEPDASPPAEKPRKQRRTPETPLPADWQPNDAHRTLAAELGVSLEREATNFREHAAEHDRRAARWHAAFSRWLRKAEQFGHARLRDSSDPPSYASNPYKRLVPRAAGQ